MWPHSRLVYYELPSSMRGQQRSWAAKNGAYQYKKPTREHRVINYGRRIEKVNVPLPLRNTELQVAFKSVLASFLGSNKPASGGAKPRRGNFDERNTSILPFTEIQNKPPLITIFQTVCRYFICWIIWNYTSETNLVVSSSILQNDTYIHIHYNILKQSLPWA